MNTPTKFKEAQAAYDQLIQGQDVVRAKHDAKLQAAVEKQTMRPDEAIARRKAFLNAQEADAAKQHVWIERLKFEV